MSDPRTEEIIRAEKLIYKGRVEEALEIINNFENNHNSTQTD